jgi:hypothetical protein
MLFYVPAKGKPLGLLVVMTDPIVFVGNVRELTHRGLLFAYDWSVDELTRTAVPTPTDRF